MFDSIDLRSPIDEDQILQFRGQWGKTIPIKLTVDQVSYGTSRARPHVRFRVEIETTEKDASEESEKFRPRIFQWSFTPTHAERVRFQCARKVLEQQSFAGGTWGILPAFQIPDVIMTALYFAADEDEANRLISLALSEMKVINLGGE